MLMTASPRLPLLPAILSPRALGSAVVHLPTLAWEEERILKEVAWGFTPREESY